MKKLLIAAVLTGFTALTAGQYITTEVDGKNLHLDLTKHLDSNIVYYIDTDNDTKTGFTCARAGISGADFAVANGQEYSFVGDAGKCDWDWDYTGGEWEEGKHNLSLPLEKVSKTSTINVTAHAYNDDWDITYNFSKYGTDEKQMKTVSVDTYDVIADGLILFRTVEGKGNADQIAEKLIKAAPALGKGWGLAHDEDMIETLQKKDDAGKLNADGKDYLEKSKKRGSVRILGFCNPNKASKATYTAPPVTAMMPCRISVFDLGNGTVGISLINATDPKFKGVMDDLKEIITNAVK